MKLRESQQCFEKVCKFIGVKNGRLK